MNDLTIADAATLTMSSGEIADLVEKRHDNVKRTIEALTEKGIVRPRIEDEADKDSMGRDRITQVYRVGKRDSYVIVAQLSPEFTARLVDRWQDLENRAPTLPRSLPEALRLAADLAEQKEKEKAEHALAIAAPKAEALDRISAHEEALTFTQAAKVLGVKRERLIEWLRSNGWICRQNDAWVACHEHIRNGRLQFKEARYAKGTGGEGHSAYCHIMPKGYAIIAEALRREPVAA